MIDLELVRWTDVRMLEVMDGCELYTMPEIAAHLGHSRSSTSVVMDRCVRLGLVRWRPATGCLRIYELTRRGDAVLAASRDMRRALQVEP